MRTINTNYDQKEAVELLLEFSYSVNKMEDLKGLTDRIGDKKIVMLGEASHGTHEFYTWRSYISQRLIEDHGFNFIAVEGDWPDLFEVNNFIQNDSVSEDVGEVLHRFDRWPTWMWANWEIAALAEKMKSHNHRHPDTKVGIYGLDVYSLWDSLHSIIKYLEENDPEALEKAKEAIRCFEPYKEEDGIAYARASMMVPEPCREEVVALLKETQTARFQKTGTKHQVFDAEQNALIAANAEKYYRTMVQSDAASWNVRDSHMMQTLNRLLTYYGDHSKAIVWAHNTHIGDSSATDMAEEGMYNIGEFARAAYHQDVALVGFGTYSGSVIAGSAWGAEMQKVTLPEAMPESWESLLHEAGAGNKYVMMDELQDTFFAHQRIGHRAVGVVYRPQFERYGNYVPSVVAKRYDAFIFIDHTHALHPLHLTPNGSEVPETYPFGL